MKFKLKLRWKDKLFLGILAFFLLWAGYAELFQKNKKEQKSEEKQEAVAKTVPLKVGGISLKAELVVDKEKMLLGLGKRSTLEDGQGMLFLHETPARHAYSMRDMQFGLDFIFIFQGKVIELKEQVPQDFPGEIIGGKDYDSVLEVSSGWVRKNGIKVGDEVSAGK